MDVRSVVKPGSLTLLIRSNLRYALLYEAPEVVLGQLNIFVLLKPVLQVQLEDGPQALDGIELGTVRW